MSKKRQKYTGLYTRLYLQVFVVGARQTLERHHESCTLEYKNTKRGIGFENQHRQVSLAPETIDTEVQTHCPDTATARRAILYCIYHIAKKHSHKITNRRQDDDGIQPIIKVKAG